MFLDVCSGSTLFVPQLRVNTMYDMRLHCLWTAAWENVPSDMWVKQILKATCASASVWSVFVVRMKKPRCLSKIAPSEDWSDCANVQSYLNLRWTYMLDCTFPGPEVIFFMLNSAEHEVCPANEFQIVNNCKFFLAKHCWAWKFLC